MPVVTRFAPSPTGLLHLGHIVSALAGWQAARRAEGRFLLRIEDVDHTRCRPCFETSILADLRWLGLAWDGPVRRQSDHVARYASTLERLRARDLCYPCFCTRSDLAARGTVCHAPDGSLVYDGFCRTLPPRQVARRLHDGTPAWRLAMDRAIRETRSLRVHERGEGWRDAVPEAFGDPVIARRDIGPGYHIAVTHDDALQGVTLVTRGRDLYPATDLHVLLQRLMDWPQPDYAHHRLVSAADGTKLSKSLGAPSIAAMRERGARPEDLLRRAESIVA